jgi:hypothetical protein
MAATDNLTSLHKHEEQLRVKSLAAVEADTTLSDHWNLVAEAMNVIYAFTHGHVHGSENELTLQYLGIRLFNAAGASVKLALSGYYQKAFDQLRDVIEGSTRTIRPAARAYATDNRQPSFGIDLDQSSSPATRRGGARGGGSAISKVPLRSPNPATNWETLRVSALDTDGH